MGLVMSLFEAEVLPGLKPFAAAELNRRLGAHARIVPLEREDSLPFSYGGSPSHLASFSTIVAAYWVLNFEVPRPRALVGHEHLSRILRAVEDLRGLHPAGAFRTFRFSAAGRDSSVFERLAGEIRSATHLEPEIDEADLVIRVRPALLHAGGWEVLLRLTPRPLSARAWRVCDYPGALNATIASAMIELTHPTPQDRFLNPMCGSGTLLVERLLRGPAARVSGGDIDNQVLACARENLTAAGLLGQADLHWMDALHIDADPASFDTVCVDPPWGQRVGERETLESLYSELLEELARVTCPGGRLVLVTHAIKRFEARLSAAAGLWRPVSVYPVFQGGLHPRIYVCERLPGS